MTGPLLDSPVVSPQWLADHLGADKLVVLDATVLPYTQPSGRPGYLSGHESYVVNGHLPGAVFADVIDDLSDTSAPSRSLGPRSSSSRPLSAHSASTTRRASSCTTL